MRRRKPTPQTWKGERLIYAKDAKPEDIQDALDLVVVGADVEALYPNLSDIEVALICYKAIMESRITFSNIIYKLAVTYIAMNLSKIGQRHPCIVSSREEQPEVVQDLGSLHL